ALSKLFALPSEENPHANLTQNTRLDGASDRMWVCQRLTTKDQRQGSRSTLTVLRLPRDQAHSVQPQPLVSQWTASLSSAGDSAGTRGDQTLVFQAQDAARGGGQSRCPRWSDPVRGPRFLPSPGRGDDFVSCGRCFRRRLASGNFDGIGSCADRWPHDVDGRPPNPSSPLFRRAESCGP